MPKAKHFTKTDILRAMSKTPSNRAAARYLHCDFYTYRKYARMYTDEATGKTLFDVHKNESGKGIPKFISGKGKEPPIEKLINGELPIESFSPGKIKDRLIHEMFIEEKCSNCGYCERRIVDYKIPLLLAFRDRNKKNYSLDNIELLCYNCYFLFVGNPLSNKQMKAEEDFSVDKKDNRTSEEFQLDEHHIEHLKELGLWDETEEDNDDSIISYK
jgi:hypothetical protein